MVNVRNTAQRWGAVSQAFHWAIVVMILAQYALTSIAEDLPAGVAKLGTLAQHKSVGITILALAILRMAWRRLNKPSPPLPADLKRYERFLAHLTHHGLYFLLVALPLSGWMMSSAKHYPVSWFGLGRPLPDLVPANETLFGVLKETHELLSTALIAVAALHALAALHHHFVRKDSILRRMLPFTAPGTRRGAVKLAGVTLVFVVASLLAFRQLLPAQPPGAGVSESGTDTAAGATNDATRGDSAWVVDAAASTLAFSFIQAGAATTGHFGQFTADIDFTATPAASGRFDVRIETVSADTLDKERNEQLRTTDLFNVAQFPQARYVATQFTPKGEGFEAQGQLTLRGVTLNVPLSFTFQPSANGRTAALKGSATIKRLAFGVGQGEWKSTEWISDDVQVSFTLQLVPRAAAQP